VPGWQGTSERRQSKQRRGDCCEYRRVEGLSQIAPSDTYGNVGPMLLWFNVESKSVGEVFAQWTPRTRRGFGRPRTTRKLREFMAADLDGNLIRVFYDFCLHV